MMQAMKIGALAARTGTSVPTIRYYESIGLLQRAARQEGGQRLYTLEDIDRLTFIRRCRDFDFSIAQVRVLVDLVRDPSSTCTTARDLAAAHLASVRDKMRELRALARSLEAFVHDCDTACGGRSGPDCTVLGEMTRGERGVPRLRRVTARGAARERA
jgi:DNA-binding transcriptional MerR regulator